MPVGARTNLRIAAAIVIAILTGVAIWHFLYTDSLASLVRLSEAMSHRSVSARVSGGSRIGHSLRYAVQSTPPDPPR